VSRIGTTIVIDRPIEDVWAFLIDPHSLPAWCPEVDQITQPSEEALGKGTTLKVSGRLGPLRSSWRHQVVDFDPHRAIELRSVGGPLGGTVLARVDLERAGAGTRFTGTSDAHGVPGILTPFGPGRRTDRDGFFAALKRSLETRTAPAAERAAAPAAESAAPPAARPAEVEAPVPRAEPPEVAPATPVAESFTAVPDPIDVEGSTDVAVSAAPAASTVAVPSGDAAEVSAPASEPATVPPPAKDAEAVEVAGAPAAEDRLVLRLRRVPFALPALDVDGLRDTGARESRQLSHIPVVLTRVEGASPSIRRGHQQDHVTAAGHPGSPLGLAQQCWPDAG